ncbi:thioesterase family protein [Saxibacter everestensis]|uniref:Thioesterase family protein n=1 Tax=Saxibacter everestensis TaxID=2909229 RepID=A0ABY8QTM9_9MICO|nr:thioesterase family protein [Brevibacteriaceae bacterium ZFBP1038]
MSTLPSYRTTVIEDWIDYNGHMSEAYYVLAFGFATDQVMEQLGLDAEYRASTGCSLYTVEAHIRYLKEASLGAALTITTTIVDAGPKKLHLAHEMLLGGELIATEELLALHVGQAPAGAVPFPEAISARIDEHSLDRRSDPPDWIGRQVNPAARFNQLLEAKPAQPAELPEQPPTISKNVRL